MELRMLRYFIAIAEERSLSGAAVRLRIAQPALSRCVRQLEDEMAVILINRHGRGISLTPAGETLYGHARRIVRDVDNVARDVAQYASIVFGHVDMALPPLTGQILAPRIVRRMQAELPHVSLRIIEGISGGVNGLLRTNQVDIGILYDAPRTAELEIRPLVRDRIALLAPAAGSSDLPNPPEPCRVADLADLPLILPSRSNSLRSALERLAATQGVTLQPIVEVDSLVMIKALVEQGVGFGLLAHGTVQPDLQRGAIRAIPIDPEGSLDWNLEIAWRRAPPGSAVEPVIRIILDEVKALARLGYWPEAIPVIS